MRPAGCSHYGRLTAPGDVALANPGNPEPQHNWDGAPRCYPLRASDCPSRRRAAAAAPPPVLPSAPAAQHPPPARRGIFFANDYGQTQCLFSLQVLSQICLIIGDAALFRKSVSAAQALCHGLFGVTAALQGAQWSRPSSLTAQTFTRSITVLPQQTPRRTYG